MELKEYIRKAEEQMAMDAILKIYSNIIAEPIYEPNGKTTPPDYLLSYESGEVVLEIVNSDNFNVSDNCNSQIPSQQGVLRELLRIAIAIELQDLLRPDEIIILTMDMPLFNKKLPKKIAKKITELYKSNSFKLEPLLLGEPWPQEESEVAYSDNIPFSIEKFDIYAKLSSGCHFRFKQTQRQLDKDNKHYQVLIESKSKSLECNIEAQVLYILETNIKSKYKKLSNIPIDQQLLPKWLAIINNNPILDFDNYQNIFNLLNPEEQLKFQKIFIIDSRSEQAYELKN